MTNKETIQFFEKIDFEFYKFQINKELKTYEDNLMMLDRVISSENKEYTSYCVFTKAASEEVDFSQLVFHNYIRDYKTKKIKLNIEPLSNRAIIVLFVHLSYMFDRYNTELYRKNYDFLLNEIKNRKILGEDQEVFLTYHSENGKRWNEIFNEAMSETDPQIKPFILSKLKMEYFEEYFNLIRFVSITQNNFHGEAHLLNIELDKNNE